MIQSGARPTKPDYRDHDFVKTVHPQLYAGIIPSPTFPLEYNTENGLWIPDQNSYDPKFGNPPLPWGCTDYTQADISADIDSVLKNPVLLDDMTNANANHGANIRAALAGAITLNWITQYFNCKPQAGLDYFDVFRLAIITGSEINEKRSISWGSPWYPSWEAAAQRGEYLMPMPTFEELNTDPMHLPWHNSKHAGWVQYNGVPVLNNKSWQGPGVGRSGFVGFGRDVINVVMGTWGTVGFTASRSTVIEPELVDPTLWQGLLKDVYRILTVLKIIVEPMPTPKNLIPTMAKCIAQYEGSEKNAEGLPDRNYRNANPGNLRCSVIMNSKATGQDKDGFCKFPTWDVGMEALVMMLTNAAIGKSKVYKPTDNLLDFFAKYSPAKDGNVPSQYASWVAQHMGLPTTTLLKDLI